MRQSHRLVPPLSPVLLAGFFLRPLPTVLFQPAISLAMARMRCRHSGMFERLSGLGKPLFLIDPIDLPFMFLLSGDPKAPRLTAIDDDEGVKVTATIRGPLLNLIDLLEGRIDGDALFFSRDLIVEGDTEAVVALRNAVEGAEIDIIADLLSLFGPLAGPAKLLASAGRRFFSRRAKNMETLRRAAVGPVQRRADALANRLGKLEESLAELKRRERKRRPRKS